MWCGCGCGCGCECECECGVGVGVGVGVDVESDRDHLRIGQKKFNLLFSQYIKSLVGWVSWLVGGSVCRGCERYPFIPSQSPKSRERSALWV